MLRTFIQLPRLAITSSRFLSAAAPASAPVDKSALMKLRKRTGYSYVNCRKALVQFGPEKLDDAEKWLRDLAKKEGWAKAAKLSSRATSQGLVGVSSNGPFAAVVELSCETDFVARGDNFKALLEKLTSSVLAHTEKQAGKRTDKIVSTSYDIDSLSTPDGLPLREVVTMAVGKLGENIGLKKAEGLVAPEGASLFSSSHPKDGSYPVRMGKFVSVVALKRAEADGLFPTDKLADQLCQHIIGMRSETLGEPLKTEESSDATAKSAAGSESSQTGEADQLNDFFEGQTTNIDEDETSLLRQAFMLNPSQSVYEYVKGHQAEIVDFRRSELTSGKDE